MPESAVDRHSTLDEAITSTQVITEAERNLESKIPKALPAFRMLVSRSLRIVEDPAKDELEQHRGLADWQDLPILIAVVREGCVLLTTFNMRHDQPGHPSLTVLKPGDLVLRIRYLLSQLSDKK